MRTNLQTAVDTLQAAKAALDAAQHAYDAACRDVAALAPHKPGDVANIGFFGGVTNPIYIERVSAYVDGPLGGRVVWQYSGKRVKRDGTPHATANQYGAEFVNV